MCAVIDGIFIALHVWVLVCGGVLFFFDRKFRFHLKTNHPLLWNDFNFRTPRVVEEDVHAAALREFLWRGEYRTMYDHALIVLGNRVRISLCALLLGLVFVIPVFEKTTYRKVFVCLTSKFGIFF